MKLQRGDKVKIRRDSVYYGQSLLTWVVDSRTGLSGAMYYYVIFSDYRDWYGEKDLDKISSVNPSIQYILKWKKKSIQQKMNW
jgi:hypothetical protein